MVQGHILNVQLRKVLLMDLAKNFFALLILQNSKGMLELYFRNKDVF